MPINSLKPISFIKGGEKSEKKIHTLTLVITRNCNLRCSYCYEKHYREKNVNFIDAEKAKIAISGILDSDEEFDMASIDLFGGEPLLAFSIIKEIFEWCQSRNWKKPYRFLVGTNATLLNEEMKEFFAENHEFFALSFSVDGNRTAHNISRDNSYDLIYPHFDFFKENWPEQPAKMTVCAETIPYVADSVIDLEEKGMNFTANIAFENFWGSHKEKEELLNIYEAQLERLVQYYIDNSQLYPVYPMLGLMPYYLGIPGSDLTRENYT